MPACIPEPQPRCCIDAAGDQGQAKSEGLSKEEDAVHRAKEASTSVSTIDSPGREHTTPLLLLKYLLSSETLVPRKLVLAAIWRD